MSTKLSNRKKIRKVASQSERTRFNLSCKSCGHVFADFLEEMAKHNAKQMAKNSRKETTEHHAGVACPKCGKKYSP